MKKRHGVLLTALTLVLGIAMLTTTLAVPQMRAVQNIVVAEEQTLQAAAAGAKAAKTPALKSPAFIPAAIPSGWDWVAGDQPLTYKVEQHNKHSSGLTKGLDDGTLTNWFVPSPIQLDILSSFYSPPLDRNVALPSNDIIIPGSKGSYSFTLTNEESFDVEYLLNITEGPETNRDFPLIFYLKDDRGNLTTRWVDLAALEQLLFIDDLVATQSRKFTLDWEWEYERGNKVNGIAGGDPEDTDLGKDVDYGFSPATEDDVPYYQLQLNMHLRAPEGNIWVIFHPNGGTVSPDRVEYNRGEQLKARQIPTPTRPGYVFKGWKYDDGTMADPDDIITWDTDLYAEWEEEKGGIDIGGWPFIPLPIPIPIPLPIIPIPLPCLKCFRFGDKCICNDKKAETKKSVPLPKTGDSMTAVYSALAMLVISGGTALYLYRKRREDDE